MFKCLSGSFPANTSFGMGNFSWGWGKDKSISLKSNLIDATLSHLLQIKRGLVVERLLLELR